MAESIQEVEFYNFTVTPQERARYYIADGMTEEDRDSAQLCAGDFENIERPMTETAVLIPVAAHQDAGCIYDAMQQYANQVGCEPFTVFLSLNKPFDLDKPSSSIDAVEEVWRAQHDFPNLDIRYSECEYSDPRIGLIRRDLWNGAFMLGYHEGRFADGSKDVIGINNDIDTTAVSPHYIARIQQHYAKHQARAQSIGAAEAVQLPVGTRVTHTVLPTHPNVGKVTAWVDNTSFQYPGHLTYEAGLVFPFSHYAAVKGFDPNDSTYETDSMELPQQMHFIPGAHLYTSPRRYIDRLQTNGTENIWESGTFGPTDNCREVLAPDISGERAEDLIVERLDSDLRVFWLSESFQMARETIQEASLVDLGSADFEERIWRMTADNLRKQLTKAENLLRQVIGSDVLAGMVQSVIDVEESARVYTNFCITDAKMLAPGVTIELATESTQGN